MLNEPSELGAASFFRDTYGRVATHDSRVQSSAEIEDGLRSRLGFRSMASANAGIEKRRNKGITCCWRAKMVATQP